MSDHLVIVTRASKLALWQAEHVRALLMRAHPGLKVELRHISTRGDRVLDTALSKIGDKGLFTAELEAALLDGSCDLAVHSFKDLPTELRPELDVLAVLEREDPRDALLLPPSADLGRKPSGASPLELLPPQARLGTSSLRRRAMALALRPDLNIGDLRGNVDTRVRKLQEGEYDGVILAAAGLLRLGIIRPAASGDYEGEGLAALPLDPLAWLPAPCQGAVAVEGRADDARTKRLLAPLNHAPTARACAAERAFLAAIEGGCLVPAGAYTARRNDGRLIFHAAVLSLDGSRIVRNEAALADANDSDADARAVAGLAEAMKSAGADAILAEVRRSAP